VGSESTRWTIIRGAAAGRTADRAEFARRYQSVIRAYLGARWRDTPLMAEIDDAVQETFLDCFKERGALTRASPESPGRFRSFLFAVVRNVARRVEERVARDRARRASDSVDLAALDGGAEAASRAFDRAWAMALLRRASRLQQEQATEQGVAAQRRVELLNLRFGEDLPIREIARRWGEDAARVHREYARAREEFKAALRDVVRDEETASAAELEAECARLLEFLK
jgi:RNA polymerase sigma-70 factor (ECF subfamily)